MLGGGATDLSSQSAKEEYAKEFEKRTEEILRVAQNDERMSKSSGIDKDKLSVTSISRLTFHVSQKKRAKRKAAFTLAEVLITLGIIGVVAAMTMPTLVEKHQKNVVVTRLQKFYTNINQAVKLSEVDNGSIEYWDDYATGEEEAFYNKYFAKYLKTVSVGSYSSNNRDNGGNETGDVYNYFTVMFADGSAMCIRIPDNVSAGVDIIFYPEASKLGQSGSRASFGFNLNKINTVGAKTVIEPYTYEWDGTREGLFSHPRYGCRKNVSNGYCAKLIQYDGWKISDDYPW